jgi:hypothetical protein
LRCILSGRIVVEQTENIVIEHLRGLCRDIGDIKGEVQALKARSACAGWNSA